MWDRCQVPPEIATIETPELGDRSYVVVAGDQAAVVDPQRDIDRVLEVLSGRRITLSHVLETHIHNDYVSGGARALPGHRSHPRHPGGRGRRLLAARGRRR